MKKVQISIIILKKKEFYCDLCGGATELDTSSVYELEKIHIQMNLNEKNFKSHSKNKPSGT